MCRQLIFISILFYFCLLISCGNRKKDIEQTIVIEQEQVNDTVSLVLFDWEKAAILKNNAVNELKEKTKSNDKIIMNFLNEYTKLVDEFNEILFKYEGYDSLNKLYIEKQRNSQYELNLKSEVEMNGFRLVYPEGMLEISQNTDFIKSEILSLVDAVSKEFINLYCNEFDNVCCDDAAIIISKEELVNRIYKWGEFSKKVAKLEYKKYVEDEFYSNLYLLFYGVENTPAFHWGTDDYETKKYNSESIDLMNKIIEKNSTSRAAEEFKPFVELLKNENFEETEKVKNYLETVK